MFSPSKVTTSPDPIVFGVMNSFNLIAVHMNWEIEIVAAGNERVLSLVTV